MSASSASFSSSPLFLAIDQGGQSSRVAVYDDAGEQLASFSSTCATRSYTGADGSACVEQDGLEILAGIRHSLARIAEFLGEDAKRLHGAGFAGQGSSLVCWHNRTGAVLSPVLSWQDRRAQRAVDALPLTQRQVQERTGLRISPHYGASKIRWCLDNIAEIQQAHKSDDARIGPIASYLFWHLLSSEHSAGVSSSAGVSTNISPANYIDPGHAQRTLLWNLNNNDWDPVLLRAFNIESVLLPACRWHNSVFGNLFINQHPVPLVSCQRDQGASLFARGMPDPTACYVNIGTGAFIQRINPELVPPEGLLVSPLWFPEPSSDTGKSVKKIYAWEATVNGAAAALDWLAIETGLPEISPAVIEQALALEPQESIYLLNAVGGLSAPWWRTDVTSRFSAQLSPTEKTLAWIESVVFQITINVALMDSAESLQKIYVSGGISRANGVCQRLADLTGLIVYRSDNTDATLQGIAYTAAGQPEQWRRKKDECFYPKNAVQLRARFIAWQEAMEKWLSE